MSKPSVNRALPENFVARGSVNPALQARIESSEEEELQAMKSLRSLFLALLLVVVPAFSFAASKKSINVAEPVKVGNTVLQPGDYVVTWDGNGPSVQVTFKQNNKTVVTAPASVEKQTNAYDGALDLKSAEGTNAKTLHAIDFKNMALIFDQGSTGSTSPTQ